MKYELLETVVLERDIPELRLRMGDLGTVVHIHPNGALEVEFVTVAGRTEAIATLPTDAVRRAGDLDLVAVRNLRRTA